MTPLLSNLLMAYVKEEMSEVRWRRVKIEQDRIYTLAYANDMVLLEENEAKMRSIGERLEEYLERKGLELNTEKTKIRRFRREGGRLGKRDWKWKGKTKEEVKEFKYLGYVM